MGCVNPVRSSDGKKNNRKHGLNLIDFMENYLISLYRDFQ